MARCFQLGQRLAATRALQPPAAIAEIERFTDPIGNPPDALDAARGSAVQHLAQAGKIGPQGAPYLILNLHADYGSEAASQSPATSYGAGVDLASLINVHDAAFCQDGAAVIAAAVAAACRPGATVESVLQDAVAHLPATSGAPMAGRVAQALDATCGRDYDSFRRHVHDHAEQFLQLQKANSLETVPLTLALFSLAKGELERCVVFAANFGRDTDTMGAMAGAIAGAWGGTDAIKPEWLEKVRRNAEQDQEALALGLARAAIGKMQRERAAGAELAELL